MKLLDIQLLVTHVIGFLIVLWLLRKYAWGPVLRFLDQRRQGIEADLGAAKARRVEADELHRRYEQHLANIETEARSKVQEGVAEGNAAKARIKEQGEIERRERLRRAEEEVQRLEESSRETLRRRTVDLAILAAEKAIEKRIDEAQDRVLIERFIDELEQPGAGEQR